MIESFLRIFDNRNQRSPLPLDHELPVLILPLKGHTENLNLLHFHNR